MNKKSRIKLPGQYKDFLLNIGGAVNLFVNDYGAGIDILLPSAVKDFSRTVFENYGEDPYPNLFLCVNIASVGWFGGFDLTRASEKNFAIFFPEVEPELWLPEANFICFNDWLDKTIDSRGTDILS